MNHIYPFGKTTNKFIVDNYEMLIDDKIKKEKLYEIESLKKYKNKWYLKIQYFLVFKKYIQLNTIENLSYENLFSWFLKRKCKLQINRR